jgi:hypothetical protein
LEYRMTQTTADTLRKAKALISDPVNWNNDGDYFKDGDPDTGCMCVYGAIHVALDPSHHIGETEKLFDDLFKSLHLPYKLIDYNDHPDTTHDDIMALFDRAIELAEKPNA